MCSGWGQGGRGEGIEVKVPVIADSADDVIADYSHFPVPFPKSLGRQYCHPYGFSKQGASQGEAAVGMAQLYPILLSWLQIAAPLEGNACAVSSTLLWDDKGGLGDRPRRKGR